MSKALLTITSSVSFIIGSIIGAGFISGREILSFFCGDLSFSTLFETLLLFVIGVFVVANLSENNRFNVISLKLVSLFNIVISACMLSALDSLFCDVLRLTENVKIIRIISLILTIFITSNGVDFISKISLFFMPFAIILCVAIIIANCDFKTFYIPLYPHGFKGGILSSSYVGMNVFMSMSVIFSICKGKSKKIKFCISVVTSAVICFLIFIISVALRGANATFGMPLLSILSDNVLSYGIFCVLIFLGIFSTLISSFYSSLTITKKRNLSKTIIISLICFALSFLKFEFIVDKIYPFIGFFGVIFVFFNCFSQFFFQALPRERTFLRRERIRS